MKCHAQYAKCQAWMTTIMQLSFKFQCPTDHTRHLIPVPNGQMYSIIANYSLFTEDSPVFFVHFCGPSQNPIQKSLTFLNSRFHDFRFFSHLRHKNLDPTR